MMSPTVTTGKRRVGFASEIGISVSTAGEYREVEVRDEVRRMAMFGSGVAELTRHRAEQIARELVERSKQNRDELMKLIRSEIQNQVANLGVPSKRDVERLERRVTRLEAQLKDATRASTVKKATAKKSTGKKTSAKKTGVGGSRTTTRATTEGDK